MKYITLILAFLLFSCGKKEDVLLPKTNVSVVKDVQDHSPIYIFFKTEGKDTIADVNRKNSIISTNWIFNIDKRLPLKLVIPEVLKLQEKKRAEKAHKNEKAENYYSYADSIGKNLAFLPFTKVYYKTERPKSEGLVIFFKKNQTVEVNKQMLKKEELLNYIASLDFAVKPKVQFCFDKNMIFDVYIQDRILVQKLESFAGVTEEYIF
ncbi:hypothetical protein BC749_102574 [Flavobacterium araucananum]|uniref:Lipoprotein n=1 Tax=Flavobacterium araucananum TaxID=946678 RepID=A0A227P9P9_9FLAO|nr:hypothetical protein [Flavobacterium araucananum]OXG06649.1 hypothetical protein B0A64_11125 [Flavobacterium araucananum]PWK01004.1 hypothetical protein BC749_102574 [Flavobacterium araucananum]